MTSCLCEYKALVNAYKSEITEKSHLGRERLTIPLPVLIDAFGQTPSILMKNAYEKKRLKSYGVRSSEIILEVVLLLRIYIFQVF